MSDHCTYPACLGRTIPGCYGVCRTALAGPDTITQLRADLDAANERAEKAYAERDEWLEEMGRCTLAAPFGYRDHPLHKGIARLRSDHDAAKADAAALRAQVERMRDAAGNATMYLDSGFINCLRCGEEVPTKDTDAEYELRAALAPAMSEPKCES